MSQRTCTIEGCERRHFGRGFCQHHHYRWRTHGSPTAGAPITSRSTTAAQRFWAKVDKSGPVPDYRPELGRCWIWNGTRSSRQGGRPGYGRFAAEGRTHQAHRFAYELLVGKIEAGLQLDHLCRVTQCVNPSHTEPVTPRENYLRGISLWAENARKTHCPQGHAYSEANTYVGRNGARKCRECSAAHLRDLRQRRGAGLAPAARTHCPQGHPYDEANTLVQPDGSRKCRECRREYLREYDKKRAGRRRKPGAVENANKTHCPQGHPYDEVNTLYEADGSRKCLTCRRESDRRRRARRRSG